MGCAGKKCKPWYILCLLFVLIFSGCTSLPDPETAQTFKGDNIIRLTPGMTAGQTFIIHRPRLDGITLWLEPQEPGMLLAVSLSRQPSDSKPIYTTIIQAAYGQNIIKIPPQSNPPESSYYLQLGIAQGELQVLGRDEDAYPDGTSILNGKPIDSDFAFQASYDYDSKAVYSDIKSLLGGSWLVIPLALLLFIPGWLLIDLTGLQSNFDPAEESAVSIGLSIAIIPIIMLWTTTAKLHWNRASVLSTAAILVFIFLWRVWVRLQRNREHPGHFFGKKSFRLDSLILPAIILLSAFIRFVMVRDLEVPAWVDSIHHNLIANRIIQTGGFPGDYLPHLPIEISRYHPGFHSLVAAFHWLTDLPIPKSMLILGQVLNTAMVLGTYYLTVALIKDKRAGWAAALITGTFSLMPAYYAGWGRYTQLAGLLILPVGFRWILPEETKLKQLGGRNFKKFFLGGILFAGLFMVHYRVLIFLLCLVVAAWIGMAFRRNPDTLKLLLASITNTLGSGFIGILVGLPWLLPAVKEFALPLANQWRGIKTPPPEITWRYLTPVLGVPVLILAGMGLLWGLYQRRRFSITLLLWIILLFGVANPGYFHMPFPSGFINQSSVEIMLFLPFSVLGGYTISQVYAIGNRLKRPIIIRIWSFGFLILGTVTAIFGSQKMIASLNPQTFLYRDSDTAGIAWLSENILADETIVINPVGWGYGLYMGADGGFWISPLTGFQTMPPNVLYGLDSENREMINDFSAKLIQAGKNPNRIWELLDEHELRYIYIGGRGGTISPKALEDSLLFRTLYEHEGTWVFKTNETP